MFADHLYEKIDNNFEVGHYKICEIIARSNNHFYIRNSLIQLWNNMILEEKTAKNIKIHFYKKK